MEGILRALERALVLGRELLQADRVVVFCSGHAMAAGVSPENLETSGELSRTVLSSLLEDGEPLVSADARDEPRYQDQISVVLGGGRSFLFVPVGRTGFLYADTGAHPRAYTSLHLDLCRKFIHDEVLPLLGPREEGAPPSWSGLCQACWHP